MSNQVKDIMETADIRSMLEEYERQDRIADEAQKKRWEACKSIEGQELEPGSYWCAPFFFEIDEEGRLGDWRRCQKL